MSDDLHSPRYTADAGLHHDARVPCLRCGRSPARTQSYMFVMSFLFFTRHAVYEDHLCRGCATKTAVREHVKSALLGWWGIPWGILTFRALWINGRSLLRWSSLTAPMAMLAGVAGLALPVGIGAALWQSWEKQRHAEETGDWVDEEVVRLVDSGHARFAEGDFEGALEQYLRAHGKAPRSSVVNYSVATTYWALGNAREALPYAEAAAAMAPRSASFVALHGSILAALDRTPEARECGRVLRTLPMQDGADADRALELLASLEDWESMLATADRAVVLFPDDTYCQASRLDALERLDRIDEMGAFLAELPDTTDLQISFFNDLHAIRTDAVGFLPRLFENWLADDYSDVGMARLANGVERAGALERLRPRIRDWLFAEGTPGDAWFRAEPWFEESRWVPVLDEYLRDRIEVVPVLMRLDGLRFATDSRAILRLTGRARALDHDLVEYVDAAYFAAVSTEKGWDPYLEEFERHTEEQPGHFLCRTRLQADVIECDPERARRGILRLREEASDRPALDSACLFLLAEADVAQGEAGEALRRVAGVPPSAAEPYLDAERIEILLAEAAFHAGDREMLRERVGRGSVGVASLAAPGLLLRWLDQITLGHASSYEEDVQTWLEREGDDVRHSPSATAQGILLAEGIVDRSWATKVAGPWRTTTLDLVRWVHDVAASDGARIDRAPLAAIARQDDPRFATRLARTTLARLESPPGT